MSNNLYHPDKWVVIGINTGEEIIYKVLGGWYGGYLDGDSWRMSSGVVSVETNDTHHTLSNYSGSSYVCHKDCYGTSGYTASIYSTYVESAVTQGYDIFMLSYEDFLDKFVEV